MNAQEILSKLSLEEKVMFCSGKNFWELEALDKMEIPSIMLTDGPHGLRKQQGSSDHLGINQSVPATCFPTASLLAATWNPQLVYDMGVAMGKECLRENVSVLLGPGVNIKRSPLGGRNFEYFSEDPYLSAEMATAMISGVQSQGVGTSLKHFAVNNQEFRRMITNAVVDERTLRELYLASFEKPVKVAKPKTIMSAYNRLNGTYCSEHPWLLDQVLRKEWGYQGVVVTDWGANNDRVEGLKAGQDLEMPGATKETNLRILKAVQEGTLSLEILDQSVFRVLKLIEETAPKPRAHDGAVEDAAAKVDALAHHQLAKTIASEGIVLLKNDARALLPLSNQDTLAVIGKMAKTPRYQGSGSSYMNPTQLDTFFDKLSERTHIHYEVGYGDDGEIIDAAVISKACDAAAKVDKVIVMIGLTEAYESEGFDRVHLSLPKAHDELVKCLVAINPNVIVILSNGAPVLMPWLHSVPAVIEGYLSGQAGAGALVDILYGDINPSGHLAETFPLDTEASKFFPGGKTQVLYQEGLYVGYRFVDRFSKEVLFPFGHGLSYTSFDVSTLEALPTDDLMKLQFEVKNTGKYAGKTTVQVYVKDEQCTVHRPEKELKGFIKVDLAPDQSGVFTVDLDRRAFSYYDVALKDWVLENGSFILYVGLSSQDLRGCLRVYIEDGKLISSEVTCDKNTTAASNRAQTAHVDNSDPWSLLSFEFEEALCTAGVKVPAEKDSITPKEYTLNTPIADMKKSFISVLLMTIIKMSINAMMKKQNNAGMKKMIESVIGEIHLRNLAMMSNGAIKLKTAEALLLCLKGQRLKGLKHFFNRIR